MSMLTGCHMCVRLKDSVVVLMLFICHSYVSVVGWLSLVMVVSALLCNHGCNSVVWLPWTGLCQCCGFAILVSVLLGCQGCVSVVVELPWICQSCKVAMVVFSVGEFHGDVSSSELVVMFTSSITV